MTGVKGHSKFFTNSNVTVPHSMQAPSNDFKLVLEWASYFKQVQIYINVK